MRVVIQIAARECFEEEGDDGAVRTSIRGVMTGLPFQALPARTGKFFLVYGLELSGEFNGEEFSYSIRLAPPDNTGGEVLHQTLRVPSYSVDEGFIFIVAQPMEVLLSTPGDYEFALVIGGEEIATVRLPATPARRF